MSAALPRPSFIPSLAYKDNRAALAWLRDAFGFERARSSPTAKAMSSTPK